MAYASPRKLKKRLREEIVEEIAIHREACLKRIEAGQVEGAGEQARLAVSAINRYFKIKPWSVVRCDGINRMKECRFCK